MRTRVVLALAAALMLLISLAAVGSNMGFKIVISIPAGSVKYVSLPYYNSFTDAASLRNDLLSAGGSNVTVYNWTGAVWQRWAGGGIGQVNFSIVPGTAYEAVSATACNWVVVGSHNPSLGVSLPAGSVKYVSVPYHSTASDAANLRNEIITAGGANVTVYNWTGSVWQRWAGGGIGQVNFPIAPGNGYELVTSAAISWSPAHY